MSRQHRICSLHPHANFAHKSKIRMLYQLLHFQSEGAKNTGCWIEDSSITFPRGGDGEDFNLNHITLMLTHTDEYEQRLVGFFETSLA